MINEIKVLKKMKFKYLFVIIFGLCSQFLNAQPLESGTYFGAGITSGFLQDQEYSNHTHQTRGLSLQAGYWSQNLNRIWNVGLAVKGLIGSAFEQEWFQYSVAPTLHFSYLYNVRPGKRATLFLGPRLDLLDGLLFINDALSNNAGYYFSATNLSLASFWRRSLNQRWNLDVGFSFVVLGFAKELTGFSFSIPQEMMDRGEFHYQRDDYVGPFHPKYYKVKSLGNYNRIRCEVGITSNNKHRFSYDWEFTHFKQSKANPMIFGNHSLKWISSFGNGRGKKNLQNC